MSKWIKKVMWLTLLKKKTCIYIKCKKIAFFQSSKIFSAAQLRLHKLAIWHIRTFYKFCSTVNMEMFQIFTPSIQIYPILIFFFFFFFLLKNKKSWNCIIPAIQKCMLCQKLFNIIFGTSFNDVHVKKWYKNNNLKSLILSKK